MKSALIKKEVQENILAFKGSLWLFVITLLFSAMSYSFVGVKEMSLLAQTEMLVTFGKLVVGLGLLISVILAAVSFSNEKEQSTLEALLLTPIAKGQLAWSKMISVLSVWLATLILATPYLLVLSRGTQAFGLMLIFLFLIGTVLVLLFAGVAMALSILIGSSKGALMTSLILLLVTSVPVFLSTAMTKSGLGTWLNTLSPVSSAMDLLKNMVINGHSLFFTPSSLLSVLAGGIIGLFVLQYGISRLEFKGGE